VQVRIAAAEAGATPKLRIHVKDTGAGFDYRRVLQLPSENTAPFGRGIPLVRRLCERMEYRGLGNEVEVLFGICSPASEQTQAKLNSSASAPLNRHDPK
jgi:hypothetical protein